MGFVRIAIIIFLVYLLFRLVKGILGQSQTVKRGQAGDIVDEMVQDPQCGTYVPSRKAVRRRIGGEDMFFCSEECASEYEKSFGKER